MFYTLKGKEVVECEAGELIMLPIKDRQVAVTDMGVCYVSTVFLCVDHNFGGHGPPLLFETMVFGDGIDELEDAPMERYSTWEQAEAGHNRIVAEMRRRLFN